MNRRFLSIILGILILSVIIGGIVRFGLDKFQQQKETQERKFNSCLESLENVSLDDLAKRAAVSGSLAQSPFVSYLGCRFAWFASPAIMEKYLRLSQAANISSDSLKKFEDRLKNVLSATPPSKDFPGKYEYLYPLSYFLVTDIPIKELCPADVMDEDLFGLLKILMELTGYSSEKVEFAANANCSRMRRYEVQPELIEAEVLNRSEWPADEESRRIDYSVNGYVVRRFLDEQLNNIPKFCRTLFSSQEVKDCQDFWLQLKTRKDDIVLRIQNRIQGGATPFVECQKFLKESKNQICNLEM